MAYLKDDIEFDRHCDAFAYALFPEIWVSRRRQFESKRKNRCSAGDQTEMMEHSGSRQPHLRRAAEWERRPQ
jgi:hypothetical protein